MFEKPCTLYLCFCDVSSSLPQIFHHKNDDVVHVVVDVDDEVEVEVEVEVDGQSVESWDMMKLANVVVAAWLGVRNVMRNICASAFVSRRISTG